MSEVEAVPGYFFAGFIDYTSFFPVSDVIWIILGTALMLGTCISVIPQIYVIIKNKSSYGLNPIAIFFTNINQFIIIVNIVCLHPTDFMGLPSIDPWYKPLSRLLTFGNAIALYSFYLPIVFLLPIFFDKAFRHKRQENQIKREKFFTRLMNILLVICSLALIITFFVSFGISGPLSRFTVSYGKVLGTVATVIVFIQYLPQMITTFRLKDPGSLSIVMLLIQAPGGTANALFLWLGQHDDWTTWISYLVAAMEQFILLGMCIFYVCIRKKRHDLSPCISNATSRQESLNGESILDAPLVSPVIDESVSST